MNKGTKSNYEEAIFNCQGAKNYAYTQLLKRGYANEQ